MTKETRKKRKKRPKRRKKKKPKKLLTVKMKILRRRQIQIKLLRAKINRKMQPQIKLLEIIQLRRIKLLKLRKKIKGKDFVYT